MAKSQVKFKYGVGRRKEASVRMRLYSGKGENLVNGQNAEKYFEAPRLKNIYLMPLATVGGEYYFTAKTNGGGRMGQAEALSLAIARALARENVGFKADLKKIGLLTRDARVRQRRMVGTGGKSRRKKQSPKR